MDNIFQLNFQGYTWDEYFYAIANKSGVLVTYKGGLDSEGFVMMKEIIDVDAADRMSDIYESQRFIQIRKEVSPNNRIFFSYAEMKDGNRDAVVSILKEKLNLQSSHKGGKYPIQLLCEGACALFPEDLLIEQS